MRFTATLQSHGKTATGVEVPAEVVQALGTSKKPAVSVTIRDHTYRSSVAVMGGVFMLSVSADVRAATGVRAGDVLELDLELDTAPRVVEVPADLAKAMSAEGAAYFGSLSYSNQRRLVMAIDAAKTDDTRQRRIAKTCEGLHVGKA